MRGAVNGQNRDGAAGLSGPFCVRIAGDKASEIGAGYRFGCGAGQTCSLAYSTSAQTDGIPLPAPAEPIDGQAVNHEQIVDAKFQLLS